MTVRDDESNASIRSVTVSVDEFLAVVTLDRPPVNALDDATMEEFRELFTGLHNRADIRAVVITGGPRIFSAGVDIRGLHAESPTNTVPRNARYQEIFQLIDDCKVPVVAALNGYALGGGGELAMACDIRVASEGTVFGLPEITLGGLPGIGGMQRLQRLVGAGKAKQLVLTGDRIEAAEAHRIGLIDEMAPEGTAIEVASELARRICSRPPLSVQAGKRALNLGRDLPLEAALEIDLRYCGEVSGTADRAESVLAFLEKREPKLLGR